MAYLYRHIRKDINQPFYIGIGSDKYFNRARDSKRRNPHWKNIINKTDWYHQIILDNLTYDEAKNKEIEFINIYKRTCDGGILVNETKGGEGTLGLRPKNAKKIYIRKVDDISGTIIELNSYNDFKKLYKAKGFSKRVSGQIYSNGYIISENRIDLEINFKNIILNGKHKNHNPIKKKFYGISPENVVFEFTDLYSASSITGASPQNICSVLKGRYKHSNKWIFYYNKDIVV